MADSTASAPKGSDTEEPDSGGAPSAAATTPASDRPVYVIGGGPGGLAAAYALRARGVRAVVLERADRVGASWRRHYDRLHLHTTRRLSALPGLPMPRRFGRWVSRDNVVRYLEKYAEVHELEIVTGVEVSRIERSPDGTGWLLHATGGRELTGGAVVVATGHNHTPRVPDWPGRDTYTGELVHAAEYRNAEPYAGRDVLVVGVGNTGAEIAVDLVEGGAARVRLSVRTAPHIVRRSTAGWAAQYTGILVRHLPVALVDRLARPMAKLAVPDLSAHGLPRPDTGLYSRVNEGSIPVQDVGLIDAVRKGRVDVVAAVEGFEDGKVVLADGSRVEPDAVIAATGYRRALEGLVGHLDVLDGRGRPVVHGPRSPKNAPGLYFTGFTNPISGMFRELALDAEKIAKAIARRGGVTTRDAVTVEGRATR
ncbi:flavin-containing monooxygenase [Streptomyces ipomoeae]|uniref:flavin-containing monooxygenase n=1 Tax=Streptomyces ipomoeae TaxID=103232 RepID=UPI00099710DB|nr:NAD(P)/FAD-dependent oxidoreductase [Streptomyces ipomoeae]MDX2694265.1 NAD(P)/FAD-dependent oxidoreductase [Streptomyces ipomoeae]MDX2839571.1 NAD(P)/FAD-dependent oxidoreductase [Streptomyces ipomoeae]TQE19665.1 NAD(P)/FAD-dependent oxidoreductase [Streptomyces ipomoeae]